MQVSSVSPTPSQESPFLKLPVDVMIKIFYRSHPHEFFEIDYSVRLICKQVYRIFDLLFIVEYMLKQFPDRIDHLWMNRIRGEEAPADLNGYSELMQNSLQEVFEIQKLFEDHRLPDEDSEDRFLAEMSILLDFQYDKLREVGEKSEVPFAYVEYFNHPENDDGERPKVNLRERIYDSQVKDLPDALTEYSEGKNPLSLQSLSKREQLISAASLNAIARSIFPDTTHKVSADSLAARILLEAEKWKEVFKEKVKDLEKMVELDLNDREIRVIPEEIAYLKNLQILSIYQPLSYFSYHLSKCSLIEFVFMHPETQEQALLTPLAYLPNLCGRVAVFNNPSDPESLLVTSPNRRYERASLYLFGEEVEQNGCEMEKCVIDRSNWTTVGKNCVIS